MRLIIELPSHWSVPQVVAILDLLEVLHQGLRDHYQLELRELFTEYPGHAEDDHEPLSPLAEFDDDIPF